jgi:ABC-type lipoprotein export system ATPase subunit
MPEAGAVLELRDIDHEYGGLRPFRLRHLHVTAGERVALVGFDRPTAETFVNLVTGAVLPRNGAVISLGRPTHSVSNGAEWLTFVERFGIVTERIVFLEQLSMAQNLAIPFSLDLEPVPADVLEQVHELARSVRLDERTLARPVSAADPLERATLRLARALALRPSVLVLEHATAALGIRDADAHAAVIGEAVPATTTVIALSADDRFAKKIAGRLLRWQPATGELTERRRRWFQVEPRVYF